MKSALINHENDYVPLIENVIIVKMNIIIAALVLLIYCIGEILFHN